MRLGPLELRREDFPDLSTGERTDRLLRALNRFGTDAAGALKGGLTFADNFNGEVRTVEFATGGVASAPAWVAPTYDAGHSASSYTPGYRKEGDRVYLRGTVSIAGTASGARMFTLPEGYRPLQLARFAANTGDVTTGLVTVGTNGEVCGYWTGGASYYALDGIDFASTAAAESTPSVSVRFKSKVVPSLVFVGAAWDVTDKAETPVALGGVAWSRSQKGDEIVISEIGGVSANRKYRVKLVIVAG